MISINLATKNKLNIIKVKIEKIFIIYYNISMASNNEATSNISDTDTYISPSILRRGILDDYFKQGSRIGNYRLTISIRKPIPTCLNSKKAIEDWLKPIVETHDVTHLDWKDPNICVVFKNGVVKIIRYNDVEKIEPYVIEKIPPPPPYYDSDSDGWISGDAFE
jgi:hypothetical protein